MYEAKNDDGATGSAWEWWRANVVKKVEVVVGVVCYYSFRKKADLVLACASSRKLLRGESVRWRRRAPIKLPYLLEGMPATATVNRSGGK